MEVRGAQQKLVSELRERKPNHDHPVVLTQDPVGFDKDDGRERKAYGRTPDGTTFIVPQTHDMVSQLFSPKQPKNFSDIIVVAILGLHILGTYLLPAQLRIPVLAMVFIFWRLCYNAGIGYLLHIQSTNGKLVQYAKTSSIFVDPKKGENAYPWLYSLLKREMETKIPTDYAFDKAPIEYNTWLVFRRLVDVILLCDFVSYCLFAIACMGLPDGEGPFVTVARWTAGLGLFFFNLWVKLDAHRVVKDYAWYWGDFFYLIEQELTFDGVFEMAPHPMYSIGYAGYYGISLMAASYRVLIISILAHAAQFAFLLLVENPHIDKTYNAPPPRRRLLSEEHANSGTLHKEPSVSSVSAVVDEEIASILSPHKLLGLGHTDLHRVTDTSVVLLVIYFTALTILTPSTPLFQGLFLANAVLWRLWYSLGIGFILSRQSTKRRWTRHFLKVGANLDEAWREWKGIYHVGMVFCYLSYIGAAWKMYSMPPNWEQGFPILKHVLGTGLIALQIWTSVSIYESLGEFGWFFGDFFFTDRHRKLNYSGIYRYLNNPERFMGLAGVWGAALITRSAAIFCLALLSHLLTLAFLELVERPHMQKLYGQTLRRESGLTKSLKRSLPSQIIQWQGSVDRILEDTLDSMEDLIDVAMPKIAAGVKTIVRDSNQLFKYPTRISISRIPSDVAGYDPQDYSLVVHEPKQTGKPDQEDRHARFAYGEPITVSWTAPLNHSKRDWIGLYKVADSFSREVTQVRSHGRWIATNPKQYGTAAVDQGILVSDRRVSGTTRQDGADQDFLSGEMKFFGDKLFWTTGVFEFRYHHDGGYSVMSLSRPLEIEIERFDKEDAMTVPHDMRSSSFAAIRPAIEQSLLRLVGNCLDQDPEIAPSTIDEAFGSLVSRDGKYAGRVVYAVQQMFGIEFAPEVVRADGNVRNLAWRVCNAKKVLQQYASLSQGRTSPVIS